jgi:hypothetical protein
MGIKDRFTRLDQVDLLSASSREGLRPYGITTVEELLGLLEADPDAARSLLHLDTFELGWLTTQARALLSPATLEAIDAQRNKIYPLGARDPRTRRKAG